MIEDAASCWWYDNHRVERVARDFQEQRDLQWRDPFPPIYASLDMCLRAMGIAGHESDIAAGYDGDANAYGADGHDGDAYMVDD